MVPVIFGILATFDYHVYGKAAGVGICSTGTTSVIAVSELFLNSKIISLVIFKICINRNS